MPQSAPLKSWSLRALQFRPSASGGIEALLPCLVLRRSTSQLIVELPIAPGTLSERFVAGDRYPVAIAALRIVVPQRKMLCAAVVPERQRICLPPEAALEFGFLEVPEQHLQDGVAFL